MQKKISEKNLWKGSQSACPSVGGYPPFAALAYFEAV